MLRDLCNECTPIIRDVTQGIELLTRQSSTILLLTDLPHPSTPSSQTHGKENTERKVLLFFFRLYRSTLYYRQ